MTSYADVAKTRPLIRRNANTNRSRRLTLRTMRKAAETRKAHLMRGGS